MVGKVAVIGAGVIGGAIVKCLQECEHVGSVVATRRSIESLKPLKELKWRLVPIRIEPSVYDRLVQIAPDGDVAKLLKQAVEKLLSEISQ